MSSESEILLSPQYSHFRPLIGWLEDAFPIYDKENSKCLA